MNPSLARNCGDLWERLPVAVRDLAQANADLAVAHPQAAQWLRQSLSSQPVIEGPADLRALARAFKQAALALGFEREDADLIAQAGIRQSARQGAAGSDPLSWPRALVDFETQPWAEHSHAACPRRMGLYVVAPNAEWIARLVEMEVPTVQLRFKSDDSHAIAREIRQAIAYAQGSRSRLYINDFWRQAIELGAYGVHLGQEDVGGADFEAIRASGMRLGLSTHGYAEMLRAARHRPSYLALGAVYPTNLKVMPTLPQGPGRLARYAALMAPHFPLVAIGGIDYARLDEILPSGVGSVAAVRAILQAPDPAQEVRRWMARCPADA